MEVQDLPIISLPWFGNYVKKCVESEMLQKSWQPAIGDWYQRHYHIDMSPLLVHESNKIEILTYKSSSEGWWHATNEHGQSTLWKSQTELLKGTSKWVPRLDQTVFEYNNHFLGSLEYIHMFSLEQYIKALPGIMELRTMHKS